MADVNTNGTARIVDGGLHRRYVTVNFASQAGKPMRFIIEIRGFCIPNMHNVPLQHAITTHETTTHANIEIQNSTAEKGAYGWVNPSNASISNVTSDLPLIQNITSPADESWWHFW